MLYREFLKCQVLDIADGEEWRGLSTAMVVTFRNDAQVSRKKEEKIPLIATAGHRKEKL